MNNQEKIKKRIFEYPTKKFHIRELARLTKLNPNTIINIVKELEKKNLVIKIKKPYITEISANIENPEFTIKKRLFNIKNIYDSKILKKLIKEYDPKSISLIGSYSRGEDIEKSDIDIVVISNKEKTINLNKFEKILNKKIHLLVTNYKKISEEFYINLINGFLLYGYIEKNKTI